MLNEEEEVGDDFNKTSFLFLENLRYKEERKQAIIKLLLLVISMYLIFR